LDFELSEEQKAFQSDAKILEIYEGAKEIEKITIAKRLF